MNFSGSDGGGISDAPTAVVSDTEGHGQVIRPRRNVFLTPGIGHVLNNLICQSDFEYIFNLTLKKRSNFQTLHPFQISRISLT